MVLAGLLFAASMNVGASVVIDNARIPPKAWVVIQPPRQEAGWSCANSATQEWTVSGAAGRGVSITPYEYSTEIRLDLPAGELVGTNRGEFGGKIEWVTRDGARHVVVPSANPVAFTERGGDVFVASGLAHLMFNSGRILRLHRADDGVWQASTVLDLGEAPSAAVRIDDATWVVLTTGGVTRIDLAKLTRASVYRNDHWWMLYARSIRPLGKTWFIGARRAVIRLTPNGSGYTEDWLVPASCRRLPAPHCECQG